ncbi:hypothetical protein [Pseudophaeobacter sp. EL27]|uniref:hypothetical protein n=1 Tax=Pseudophaeobacter sp. EL27 TaxID=2107580 RepID=UPI0013C4613B|nr:hypothetical protein [Pseudophaeobacter sp. EL27]
MLGKIIAIFEPLGIEPTSLDGKALFGQAELGLFIYCMNWLIHEEVIRVDACRGEGRWIGCQLTSKGIFLLGREVEIGGKWLPMREAVKEAEAGTWDRSKAGELMGGFFAGAFKALAS